MENVPGGTGSLPAAGPVEGSDRALRDLELGGAETFAKGLRRDL